MTSSLDKYFSQQDMQRIAEAVREAETKTSGEIVPYAVHKSDVYEEALWRAGALFGVITFVVLSLMRYYSQTWDEFGLLRFIIAVSGAALVGILLTQFFEPVKRLFAGRHMMEHRVAQRAAEAFLAEEVFKTRERTGVLIFLSMMEHKVFVLGDSGINAKVQKSEWDGIVRTIVNAMAAGKPADGLVDAVGQCGNLLNKEGVEIRSDDTNELDNSLRRSES